MEAICAATATTGAALLQSDIRTPDVPMTPSVSEMFKSYFENNLHLTDVRAVRGVPLLLSGRRVVRDQDLFSSESVMLKDPLYANLSRFRIRWFSAISLRSGPSLWGMTLQRSINEGMFQEDEIKVLAALSESLTEVATLSRAVGRQVLLGTLNAFDMINEPAVSLTSGGIVLDMNKGAAALFDADLGIRNKRFYIRDGIASQDLDRMLWDAAADDDLKLRSSSCIGNVIVVRREAKKPILIEVLPVHGAARSPFLGARFILTLRDLDAVRRSPPEVLSEIFSLTPAEAKVASMIAAGASPEEIANELNLSRETVRNQLKAIFGKTGTHRQNELVALVSRI
jgi:DNA-binding CsgD family transcriptional regulator